MDSQDIELKLKRVISISFTVFFGAIVVYVMGSKFNKKAEPKSKKTQEKSKTAKSAKQSKESTEKAESLFLSIILMVVVPASLVVFLLGSMIYLIRWIDIEITRDPGMVDVLINRSVYGIFGAFTSSLFLYYIINKIGGNSPKGVLGVLLEISEALIIIVSFIIAIAGVIYSMRYLALDG